MSTAEDSPLSTKLVELLDELDREVRSLQTARALSARGLNPTLAAHTVEGLRHLLDGKRKQAARMLEAVVEELLDRTVNC